jgi:hypothetical protein
MSQGIDKEDAVATEPDWNLDDEDGNSNFAEFGGMY